MEFIGGRTAKNEKKRIVGKRPSSRGEKFNIIRPKVKRKV